MECSIRGASQEILLMGFMAVRSENLFRVLILVQSKQMEVGYICCHAPRNDEGGRGGGRVGERKRKTEKKKGNSYFSILLLVMELSGTMDGILLHFF